jgi:hypothetical protein
MTPCIIVVSDHAPINAGLATVAIDSADGFARRAGARAVNDCAIGPI